ncbi:MAG: phosphotransferase family protein [Acetobacteraceae bacterium]|nr:phosphotransferase family protein [Acetobacteraceae bacterium]
MPDDATRDRLTGWLADRAGARSVVIDETRLLAGGAIQQNWKLVVRVDGGPHDGVQEWVLRTDAQAVLSHSHGRLDEFALLKAAFAAGVPVPEPLFSCVGQVVLGRPYFVMRLVRGTTAPRRIVRGETLGGGREALTESLGRILARIHTIRPGLSGLDFLPPPPRAPMPELIADFRARVDADGTARPVFEWGFHHLEQLDVPTDEIVLCHNDFRTGNFMVSERGVEAVLDWEFARWGDPLADIGWFCSKCWRFNSPHEAGGIGSRAAFYRGYEAECGRRIARDRVQAWELFAALRWGVIASEQADRHVSGREHNLELALTGQIIPELELDILELAV